VSRERVATGCERSERRDERFGKACRLLKRSDFLRVQRQGVGHRGRSFVVVVHRRDDAAPARLGVVASRKVGMAVARNRGKRLVREWFRRRPEPLPAGIDVVIILRAGAPQLTSEAVCRELEASLAKALARRGGDRGAGGGRPGPRAKGQARRRPAGAERRGRGEGRR